MEDADDFGALLDDAFGIDDSTQQAAAVSEAPCKAPLTQHMQTQQQRHDSSSSLSPSPAASPVHTYPAHTAAWAPAGSPCMSDASMQMHASPPHSTDYVDATPQYAPHLYSPVRPGSPEPPIEDQQQDHSAQTAAAAVTAQQRCDSTASGRVAGDQQQPAAHNKPHHHQQQHNNHSLCSLPREVQMRVLCFLSADSLTSLGRTSSQWSGLCNEPVLWRRMFVHRWGKNVRHANNRQSWKVRYMERDAAELDAAGAGLDNRDVMQDIFLQAHKAKRHKALGIGAVDDLMLVEDDEVAAKVLAWRKARGFVTSQQGLAGLSAAGDNHHQHHHAQPQRPTDLSSLPQTSASQQHQGSGGGGGSGGSSHHHRGAASGFGGRSRVVVRRAGARAAATGQGAGSGARTGGGGGASIARAPAAAAPAGDGDSLPHGSQPPPPAAAAAAAAAGSQSDAAAACSQAAPTDPATTAPPQPPKQPPQPPPAAAAAAGDAGGQGSSSSSRGVKRRRSRQPRRWTQIGNVFCDEQTGWVHVCDETCSEKIIEPSSGLLVCPISGTCSARLLTCAEEAEEEGDRDPDKEHRGEEDFGGERGRLARAFAAGYYCSNEQELLRECGVYLPH